MNRLVVLSAVAGLIGGALRMATALIPPMPDPGWNEALYGIVDVGMMLGLIGFYLKVAARVGLAGLAGFVLALIGIASLVGPDGQAFGVDFYRLGAALFLAGLVVLAVSMSLRGSRSVAALLWLASASAAGLFMVMGHPVWLSLAGLALGGGFVAAGVSTLRWTTVHPTD